MCFTYVATTCSRCFIRLRCLLHSGFILHKFQVVLRVRGHRGLGSGEPVDVARGMLRGHRQGTRRGRGAPAGMGNGMRCGGMGGNVRAC